MQRTLKPLAMCVMLAVAAPAFAADLMSIYRDALVSDPAYQSARFDLQATRERIPQAQAGLRTQIGASASVNESATHQTNPGTNPFTGQSLDKNSNSGSRSYGVSLTQPLYRKQTSIAIEQAKNTVAISEARFADAKQDLGLRVATAYFDVLLAEDNSALSAAQKQAFAQQLEQAKRNFEVGTATIVDQLEAQARYDQSVAREIADNNDLEVKRRALEQLIGKPAPMLDPLRDPLELKPAQPNRLDDWVNAARERSYAVAQARSAYDIAKQEIDRNKAAYYPTVDAVAGVTGSRGGADSLRQFGPNTYNGSIGISVSVPLFTGGLNESRVREALAAKDRSEQDLERAVRTAAQAARTSYLNVNSGISQVQALEQALASANKQLDSTRTGRDVGVRTNVDVLNAQQQVFQARRDLQAARYQFLLNTLRLKSAAGDLKEEDLEQVNRTLTKRAG